MPVLCVKGQGVHFTNNFSILIQIPAKIDYAFIRVVVKWSLQMFAHATTGVLSRHVQNFVAMGNPTLDLQ